MLRVFLFTAIGWIYYGVFGGIIGAVIGIIFSIQTWRRMASMHAYQTPGSPVQTAFFRATFFAMGCLAKADGRVNEQEIHQATMLMQHMNLSSEQRRMAIDFFNEGKQGGSHLEEVLRDFKDTTDSVNLMHMFLEIQIQAAYVDGDISPEEQEILGEIARVFGISKVTLEILKKSFRAKQAFYQKNREYRERAAHQTNGVYPLQKAYEVLGIQPDTSYVEAKRAYRKLMNAHHPDKLVARGLPKQMQEVAKQKTQEIQAAWDVIRKHKDR